MAHKGDGGQLRLWHVWLIPPSPGKWWVWGGMVDRHWFLAAPAVATQSATATSVSVAARYGSTAHAPQPINPTQTAGGYQTKWAGRQTASQDPPGDWPGIPMGKVHMGRWAVVSRSRKGRQGPGLGSLGSDSVKPGSELGLGMDHGSVLGMAPSPTVSLPHNSSLSSGLQMPITTALQPHPILQAKCALPTGIPASLHEDPAQPLLLAPPG